jgi:small subunit ribosomal protein S15
VSLQRYTLIKLSTKKEEKDMALSKERVAELIKEYGKNANDSGSPAVQIALLTEKIIDLTAHLKANKKDHHSRRGLLIAVGKRRNLLDYLNRTDRDAYIKLIASLGIRK